MPPLTDRQDIVATHLPQAQVGKQQAQAAVIAWLETALRPVAKGPLGRVLAGKFDAADILQETLLKAWKGLATFHGSSAAELLAWGLRIYQRCFLDHLKYYGKKSKRDPGRELSLADSPPPGSTEPPFKANVQEPLSELIRQEDLERIQQALAALPELERQVFLLRHEEELSFEAMSKRRGRSAEALRQAYRRAEDKIRYTVCNCGRSWSCFTAARTAICITSTWRT
jgi:RNA polymerase sigma factor (sigma-70 family)